MNVFHSLPGDGRIESPQLKQLLQLFESCVHLSASDSEGRLLPRDFHKAVGGQSLGDQVFNYLARSKDEGEDISVDELMRFITNMTAAS